MTTRQEILVACLVESSVTLLHEWGAVLVGYLSPLLQRIAAGGAIKGSRNEFRIGFVSYSDPYVHPNPILAKRFFSPPFQLTKELKDDPASLGLGRTASGGRRGMAILEGYVAVLEMFDALVDTKATQPLRPHTSNEPQQDPSVSESMCYLIHIASSPPNRATRPAWNMNPALDTVTWKSLPSHLLKRKIRTIMVLTRPIAELQELYGNLSRTPEPFWLPVIRPSHKLLLSGLPPVKDKMIPQKRAAVDNPEAISHKPARPQPPEQNPTLLSANPTPHVTTPPIVLNNSNPHPASVAPSQEHPDPQAQPQSHHQLSAQHAQSRPNPPGQSINPAKLLGFIRTLDAECLSRLAAIKQAQTDAKPAAELDIMQNDLNQKVHNRQKLVAVYHQVISRQQQQPPGAPDSNPANQNLHQMGQHLEQVQARVAQEQPMTHIPQPNATASGSGLNTQPNATADTPLAVFGGVPMGKNSFQGIPISARPGMEAQMQKLLAERTRPPVLAAAQPSQNHLQPTQGNTNSSGTNPQIAEIMTPRMNLGPYLRRWQGVLAWPSANNGARKENQIAIALFTQDSTSRYESWPQKLTLQPSRALLSMSTIQTWNKESNPVMGLISHTPLIGNFEATAQNMRLFRQLREMIHTKNMLAYCKLDIAGGPPGTGVLVFATNAQPQSDILVAMIFNNAPLPAAVTTHVTMQVLPMDAGGSGDATSMHQPMGTGATPLALQNMTPETKAFLQQRQAAYNQQQAAAVAAYNQQQAAHQQQTQHNGMVPGGSSGPGSMPNVAQFMQTTQRTRWDSE